MNDLGQKITTADVHIDKTFPNSHFIHTTCTHLIL